MARFNQRPSGLLIPAGPIVSTSNPAVRTGNNAPGFTRDPKGELFLLAVGNFVGMDTHYESGVARDQRFLELVMLVAADDPEWMGRFLPWLRNEANMRTASLVAAIEAARTMATLGIPGGRQIVNSVLTRADEPGEALGYWRSTYPGKQIPKPIKRGVADAVSRLYNERNTLKYDTASKGFRFGHVLELVHAKPTKPYQVTLFRHLVDRGQDHVDDIPSSLTMLHRNALVRDQVARGRTAVLLESETLAEAGMTWEDVLSLAGSNGDKKSLWEAMIPNMGYMALLRNLRNFDVAGVGTLAANYVCKKLADPEEVAKSRQLPMRFLSAFRAVSNVRWSGALQDALELSLLNVPEFKGRTLILIDTSSSMNTGFGRDTELRFWDAAAIFGLALAQRCEHADVVSFSTTHKRFPLKQGESLLVALERFRQGYFLNHGTATQEAVRANYRGHDRVVILTDEQADYHGYHNVAVSVPDNKMVITFNLAGYRAGHAESGTPYRIAIGGLSDKAFLLMPTLERRAAGQWPF